MGKRRRVGWGVSSMACYVKPALYLLSIPGYLDDGETWASIIRHLARVMTPLDWGLMAVGAVGVAMAVWPEKRKDPKVVVADANPMRAVGRLGEATGRASPATYRQLRDVGLSRCKCVVVMARQRAKRLRGGYGGHK